MFVRPEMGWKGPKGPERTWKGLNIPESACKGLNGLERAWKDLNYSERVWENLKGSQPYLELQTLPHTNANFFISKNAGAGWTWFGGKGVETPWKGLKRPERAWKDLKRSERVWKGMKGSHFRKLCLIETAHGKNGHTMLLMMFTDEMLSYTRFLRNIQIYKVYDYFVYTSITF